MVRAQRVFRDLDFGFGIPSFAALLGCGGSRTHQRPPHVLGHIGYAVVPWKEGRGYAKLALKLMLEHARAQGLEYVEITTDPNNVASRRVIEVNGGVLIGRFQRPAQYGRTDAVRYRITL